jgi:hypothetical protein
MFGLLIEQIDTQRLRLVGNAGEQDFGLCRKFDDNGKIVAPQRDTRGVSGHLPLNIRNVRFGWLTAPTGRFLVSVRRSRGGG